MRDAGGHLPFLPGVRTRVPVGTISILVAWTVGTVAYRCGAVDLWLAVRRDPEALAAGQWWRVLTPVLVQPDPWAVVGCIGVLAAVVGSVAERVFGTRRWVVLWVAGALAGHVVGEAWQPYSSGISVAFYGPLGGLAVWAAVCRARSPDPAPPPMVALPVLVVGGGVLLAAFRDIHGPAILAGVVAAVSMVRRHRA
jgi:rhomboid protease GluP